MKAYAVRQKSSGMWIPNLPRGKRRGGSHLEPTSTDSPRLFPSMRSARAFLGNWLQGIHKPESFDYDWNGNESSGGVVVVKQPHRVKEDMEIVEFELMESKRATDDFSQDVRADSAQPSL